MLDLSARSSLTVLVVGGKADPHIDAVSLEVARFGGSPLSLVVGKDANPAITWRLDDDALLLNGEIISPDAAFIRFDVFTHLQDKSPASAYRAHAWYSTLGGWILAHPEMRTLNRKSFSVQTNKAAVLYAARDCGLEIPQTVITNDIGQFFDDGRHSSLVVKPVTGGDYCRRLSEIAELTETRDGVAASPAIVQCELVSPDVRVYFVDGVVEAFRIVSERLDYRADSACSIQRLEHAPSDVLSGLHLLLDRLQVDFAAADFKTSPDSDRLVFLEVNTAPMFCGFDAHGDGRIAQAIARYLCGMQPSQAGCGSLNQLATSIAS